MRESMFDIYEVGVMILLAFMSAMMNAYLPIKEFTSSIGLPGPAAGIAVFGGFLFVFWITLAQKIVRKRFAAIATALLTSAFCMIFSPWFSITSPPWFSAYSIPSLLSVAVLIEIPFRRQHRILKNRIHAFPHEDTASFISENTEVETNEKWITEIFGGLGNIALLVISWICIGYHTSTWIPHVYAPIYIMSAFISGFVGSFWACLISSYITRMFT